MKPSKKQLKKLKSSLPKHYAETLAKDQAVSVDHVYKVLAGTSENIEVIEAAVELAKKHKDSTGDRSKNVSEGIAAL